jgi:hypothetical protein
MVAGSLTDNAGSYDVIQTEGRGAAAEKLRKIDGYKMALSL